MSQEILSNHVSKLFAKSTLEMMCISLSNGNIYDCEVLHDLAMSKYYGQLCDEWNMKPYLKYYVLMIYIGSIKNDMYITNFIKEIIDKIYDKIDMKDLYDSYFDIDNAYFIKDSTDETVKNFICDVKKDVDIAKIVYELVIMYSNDKSNGFLEWMKDIKLLKYVTYIDFWYHIEKDLDEKYSHSYKGCSKWKNKRNKIIAVIKQFDLPF